MTRAFEWKDVPLQDFVLRLCEDHIFFFQGNPIMPHPWDVIHMAVMHNIHSQEKE